MELLELYDAHAARVGRTLSRIRPELRDEHFRDMTDRSTPFAALTRAILAR